MPSIRNLKGQYVGHFTEIIPEKVFEQISINKETDCWLWTGRLNGLSYPVIFKPKTKDHKKGETLVHRWIFQYYKGEIQKGFHVHHICNNKICVNPQHLEALDVNSHLKKGNSPSTINSRKTHCKRGHSLDNAYIEKPNGKRHCIICRNNYMKEYYRNVTKIKNMGD